MFSVMLRDACLKRESNWQPPSQRLQPEKQLELEQGKFPFLVTIYIQRWKTREHFSIKSTFTPEREWEEDDPQVIREWKGRVAYFSSNVFSSNLLCFHGRDKSRRLLLRTWQSNVETAQLFRRSWIKPATWVKSESTSTSGVFLAVGHCICRNGLLTPTSVDSLF